MGYASFSNSPKALTTSDQIGSGQIELRHLSPSLFTEFRQIALHNHSGTKSRKIDISNLEGSFKKDGFIIWSSDGTKRYQVTVDSSLNAFVLTELT